MGPRPGEDFHALLKRFVRATEGKVRVARQRARGFVSSGEARRRKAFLARRRQRRLVALLEQDA